MSKNRSSVDKFVVCPFYRWSDPNRICCEGLDDTNTNNLVFGDPGNTRNFIHNYCSDMMRFKYCSVYRMLIGKYGGK